MDCLFIADTSDTPPAKPSNPARGYPSNGNAQTGQGPTIIGAWFFYALFQEFKNLWATMGITPDEDNLHQLADFFTAYMNEVRGISPVPMSELSKYVTKVEAETIVLPGTIQMYLGTTIPNGYLLCNGGTIQRSQYPRLVPVLGNIPAFRGDGSTTLVLPNLHDRFLQMTTDLSKVGQYVEAGLPNITGGFTGLWRSDGGSPDFYGASYYEPSAPAIAGSGGNPEAIRGARFDASRANSLYGSSTTVQPPAVRIFPLIKF